MSREVIVRKYGLVDYYLCEEYDMVYQVPECITRSIISRLVCTDGEVPKHRVFRLTPYVRSIDIEKNNFKTIIHQFKMVSNLLMFELYRVINHTKVSSRRLDMSELNKLRKTIVGILGYRVFTEVSFPTTATSNLIDTVVLEEKNDMFSIIEHILKMDKGVIGSQMLKVIKTIDTSEILELYDNIIKTYLDTINLIIDKFNKGKFIGRKNKVKSIDELIKEYIKLPCEVFETVPILHTQQVLRDILRVDTEKGIFSKGNIRNLCLYNGAEDYDREYGQKCAVYFLGYSDECNDILLDKLNNTSFHYHKVIIYDFSGKYEEYFKDGNVSYYRHEKDVNVGITNEIEEATYVRKVIIDYDILHDETIRKKIEEIVKIDPSYIIFNSYNKVLKEDDVRELGGYLGSFKFKNMFSEPSLLFRSHEIIGCDMKNYTNDLDKIIEYLTTNEDYKCKFMYDVVSNSIGVYGVSKDKLNSFCGVINNNELGLSEQHHITYHSEGIIISKDKLKSGLNESGEYRYYTTEYTLKTYNSDLYDSFDKEQVLLITS